MRKKRRSLISRSALAIMIGAIFFVGKPQLSSGQSDGFEIYQLNVFCGDTSLASAIFGHRATAGGTIGRPLMGTKVICVGKCGGDGPVTLESALARLPAKVAAALQAKVDEHQQDAAAGKGWRLTCLGDDKPPEDKKSDCRGNSDSPIGRNCCDNLPGRGSLYADTLDGRIYSEPSTNSTVVGSPPSGTRLRYTNTTQVNRQTWYYIESPGRERKGWMSGSQLSCTRPVEPPAPKIIIPLERIELYKGRAAHAHAARG